MVDKASHAQAATKFRVKQTLVSRLVKAFKKDCGFVQAVREWEELRSSKVRMVVEAATDIMAT